MIKSISFQGANGLIEGSPEDKTVMGSYIYFKSYSLDIVNVLKIFFGRHKGGTFIDIGANIGLVSIPVAISLPCDVDLLCFEPCKRNFYFLQRNLERNVKGNVRSYNVALYSERKKLRLGLHPENHGDNRIVSAEDKIFADYEEIDATILHDYEIKKKPVAIKMDTQGAEYHIVKGGRKTIQEAEMVTMEFWPYGLHRQDSDVEFLVSFMCENFSYVQHSMELWRGRDFEKSGRFAKKLLKYYTEFLANTSFQGFYDLVFNKAAKI